MKKLWTLLMAAAVTHCTAQPAYPAVPTDCDTLASFASRAAVLRSAGTKYSEAADELKKFILNAGNDQLDVQIFMTTLEIAFTSDETASIVAQRVSRACEGKELTI